MTSAFAVWQFGLLLFEAVLLVIVLSNMRTLRRLQDYAAPIAWPRVSILVPARNEAANIGLCVKSLLAQNYPNFEVLALDDQSTDDTWQILTHLAAGDDRLQILRGQPLPSGWLGKHWACHQLARAARGELLLFIDADTYHTPSTLTHSVAALLAEQVDLLTVLPRQEIKSWGERLLVPIIPWSIVAFVPLTLAYRLRLPILSAAIGQFMLFRRQAYEQIGGHEAVRDDVVDDLALGRRIKAFGQPWRLVDGGAQVRCRMYRDFKQAYHGLSKNLFAIFGNRIPPFLFVWTWLAIVFWQPLIILALVIAGADVLPLFVGQALIAVVGAVLLWDIIYRRFGFPRYLVALYPVTILLVVITALRSMILTRSGRATWKERVLA